MLCLLSTGQDRADHSYCLSREGRDYSTNYAHMIQCGHVARLDDAPASPSGNVSPDGNTLPY
ncbi:hypothetical protein KCP71_04480 [Salmonella enterica subsp. enterica]|nr:hypothetical protein KCP71_04480 [Salmonella enterica subsp. enterica]